MSPRIKTLVANLGLLGMSVALSLIVLEGVVFRYVLPPDDLLENVTINRVVRYLPKSQATFRHPDGRTSLVTINADGWNSSKPEYKVARPEGVKRIAVVGDSYVHAAYVNNADAFPEVMERELKARGANVEVLRFGMDGAPLSQYLQMLRREVRQYKPDIVVVQLVHNDFDESYRFLQHRTASSFMKVGVNEAGSVSEIPPVAFKPGIADELRQFRTFRYLYYKTNAYLHFKRLISRFWWGGEEDFAPEWVSSAVDIRKINDHEKNRYFARYILDQMQKVAHEDGFELVIAMDGVREAIYEQLPPSSFEVGRLNRIAADVTRELGLPFIDLQAAFAVDYELAGERFEFPYDWHWNVRGNRVAGEAITRFLLTKTQLAAGLRPVPAGLEAKK